ncbi:MAG TPA: HD domain-containing protein [Dehalococcoidia bacterium]|nr:HD domain-containing protein [Dehalococcoidia bacterium]
MFNRPLYRTRQFLGALRPSVDSDQRGEAVELLGERLWPLFESMNLRDQRHSMDTYRLLKEQGQRDRDLLTAALLHDIGKGRIAGANVRLWHRVAYVVLNTLAPSTLKRRTGHSGLSALHQHAERGAVVAEALGAPAAVVDLIRRHHEEDPPDAPLRLLRSADDSC